MRNKYWISISLVLALSLVLAACGEEGGETDGGKADQSMIDQGGTDVATGDTATDGSQPPAEYYYVKIEDLSTATGGDGADIDAVELVKSGTSSWAQTTESCKLPAGTDCANKDKATGASDAFCTTPSNQCWSNVEVPTDNPATIPPYVSLGGYDGTTSGTLIVKMANKIENGDKLVIYEMGNCDISEACTVTNTVKATPESIKVSVATSTTGTWTVLLTGSDTTKHPKVEISVSGL